MREIRFARFGFGRRCVESIVECDKKSRALYQGVIFSLTPNVVSGKVCIFDYSHRFVTQWHVSRHNVWELSPMESMVRVIDNGMGSNMY